MSDFKAKMLKNPKRPRWESLQRSPDPLAGFKGPTSKGSGGREWMGGEERGREGRGGNGRGVLWSPKKSLK